MAPIQLADREAVKFLQGANSVRDGHIVRLSIREVESQSVVNLVFHARNGNVYNLELSGSVAFDYNFSSEYTPQQIAMVKCLWTDDGYFYLSLDPWKEDEAFVPEQDNDWFKSKSVTLTAEPIEILG
jgi:hypothetical protein